MWRELDGLEVHVPVLQLLREQLHVQRLQLLVPRAQHVQEAADPTATNPHNRQTACEHQQPDKPSMCQCPSHPPADASGYPFSDSFPPDAEALLDLAR